MVDEGTTIVVFEGVKRVRKVTNKAGTGWIRKKRGS